jgi:alpha-tubulin suppressor-like RCC1 family protein
MIPIKTIDDKADLIIAGTPTSAELAQLVAVGDYLDDVQVLSAATVAALPSAANNKGIIYYVTDTQKYYFSDGTNWRLDFTSDFEVRTLTSYAWGLNTYGRLGDGTTTSRSSPVSVVGGIINWKQISAGHAFTAGITEAGIAYAWGNNLYGQLGDNTTSSRSSPVTVVGGITTWNQISANYKHCLALTSAGVAYTWGANIAGGLGNAALGSKSSPTIVVGGITTWSKVSCGIHSLGLTTAGILYSWGYNAFGQLGDGTTTGRLSPVTVVGGITTWNQISAGAGPRGVSLGVTTAGILYSWGYGVFGGLGDNTTSNKSSPVTVVGGITNWSSISNGNRHSLGLRSSGLLYGWGRNNEGAVGDNTTNNTSSPVTVVGGITNWSGVEGGGYHSLGLTSAGVAYAWGQNTNGHLGDNTATQRNSPVTVVGGITTWAQVSGGQSHSAAINAVALYNKGFV